MSNKDPEKRREYYRQYRSVNREHLDELNRKWYAENKEKRKEYYRKYYSANKEHINARRKQNYRIKALKKFEKNENTNDHTV